jgi:hypothetical protein
MATVPLQVQLPTGEIIWAKVGIDGPSNVSAGIMQHLNVEELRKIARGVSASLREAFADVTPDQVQVEFGLELSIKSGKLLTMLAEAGGAATLKVTLSWDSPAAFHGPA